METRTRVFTVTLEYFYGEVAVVGLFRLCNNACGWIEILLGCACLLLMSARESTKTLGVESCPSH